MKTLMTINRAAVTEGENADKISPQAAAIIDTVVAKVGIGAPLDRTELVKELESSGKLNTRQDVGRVVSYYQPRLQEVGILEVTKESEASDTEKKPAKPRGTSKKSGAEPAKAETPAEAAAS